MEVKVKTWHKSIYTFSKEEDGTWTLFRHNRSYYHLCGVVTIKRFRRMKFVARKFDPLKHVEKDYRNIRSSIIMKIWVDGVEVKSFVFD